jgi:hypothetical protein
MRYLFGTAALLVAVAIVSNAGQKESAQHPHETKKTKGAGGAGLKLEIALTPAATKEYAPVAISITYTNLSSRPAVLLVKSNAFGEGFPGETFEITRGKAESTYTILATDAAMKRVEIGPGKSWKRTLSNLALELALPNVLANDTDGATGRKVAEKQIAVELRDVPWRNVIQWLADETECPVVMGARVPKGTFTFVGQKRRKYSVQEVIEIINGKLLAKKYFLIQRRQAFSLVDLNKYDIDHINTGIALPPGCKLRLRYDSPAREENERVFNGSLLSNTITLRPAE